MKLLRSTWLWLHHISFNHINITFIALLSPKKLMNHINFDNFNRDLVHLGSHLTIIETNIYDTGKINVHNANCFESSSPTRHIKRIDIVCFIAIGLLGI